jgi:hypothetical protein
MKMALFNKSKQAPVGAQRLNSQIQAMYDEVFHFDGEDFWMGVNGSTVLTIRYLEHQENAGSVHINAHVVRKVRVTPQLCQDLLTNPEYHFLVGRWRIEPDDEADGLSTVLLGAELLDQDGSLNIDDLGSIVGLLAESADNIDDELAARHGGMTAVDSFENE